jgi:hypothetical protein
MFQAITSQKIELRSVMLVIPEAIRPNQKLKRKKITRNKTCMCPFHRYKSIVTVVGSLDTRQVPSWVSYKQAKG